MKTSLVVVSILTVGLTTFLGLMALTQENDSPGQTTAAPQQAGALPMSPTAASGPMIQTSPMLRENRQTSPPPPSVAQDLDRLIASGRPADAFQAAQIIQKCASLRTLPEQVPASGGRAYVDVVCGDITSTQMVQFSRLAEHAALARLPGAAVLFASAAPDGRGNGEVWRDPAYGDWQTKARRMLIESANDGDESSLLFLADANMNGLEGDHPEEAIKYNVAYFNAVRMRQGSAEVDVQLVNRKIAALGKSLSPQAISDAVRAGEALCCKRR